MRDFSRDLIAIFERLNAVEQNQAKMETIIFGHEDNRHQDDNGSIVSEIAQNKKFRFEIRAMINRGFGMWWLASIILQLIVTILLHKYSK